MSRRELGSIYTPQAIAGRMARACLGKLFGTTRGCENGAASSICRVLDPACGDGAILMEVFDELCRRRELPTSADDASRDRHDHLDMSALRLAIVRDHIFGVDIDPPAVEALRKTLLERIEPTAELIDEAVAVVGANIRHGDSLAGPNFTVPANRTRAVPTLFNEQAEGLDHVVGWPGLERSEAPVGEESGRRPNQQELMGQHALVRKGAGISEVDRAGSPPGLPFGPAPAAPGASAQTPIDWRRDFPAAAAAGGFDIIIGNPPYVRERNAKPLFDALAATDLGRLWREPRMDLWYYFVHRSLDLLRPGGILSFIVNSYWMSSRGAGKLIERLRQETSFEEIVLLENARVFKDIAGRHMIFRLRKSNDLAPTFPIQSVLISRQGADPGTILDEYTVSHEELYQPGRLVVARPDPGQAIFQGRAILGEWYDTRQGMAENPPAINRRLHCEFAGRYPVGTGVFVLQQNEVERLHLSAVERALLRPYYDTRAVGRYRITDEPTHQVLYLSRRTSPNLEGLGNFAAHLDQFRPILERRREVRSGRIAWWQLHWPRNEQIFIQPRVLCVQMGKRPQFVFAERPTFVGFSINLILSQAQAAFALDVLCGILNSDLAWTWFDRHTKRRGINLEINAHLLRQFPLPGRDAEFERTISELVRERQAVRDDTPRAVVLEQEIEGFVWRLFSREAQPSAAQS